MNALDVKVWIDGGYFYVEVPASFTRQLVEDIARESMKKIHSVPLLPSLTECMWNGDRITYIDSRDYHDRINPDDYPYK